MIEPKTLEPPQFIRAAVVCEGGLLVAALVTGWFLQRPPLEQVSWSLTGLGQGLLAAVPLVLGMLLMAHFPVGPLKAIETVVKQVLLPLFGSASWSELLLVSALAGFGEEMLFRGVMQAGIEQFSGSPTLAIVVASAVFGMAHPITPAYAILAAAIGAYLGWLLLATDNLLVPIVAHAAYDFVALLYMRHRYGRTVAPGEPHGSELAPIGHDAVE